MSRTAACQAHPDGSSMECPAHEAIRILQEKWVLHIVHALLAGPRGFNELGREVGGCNPTTLAHRLCRLEELGIVDKETSAGAQARSSYSLTQKGESLSAVIDAIQSWAASHLKTGS